KIIEYDTINHDVNSSSLITTIAVSLLLLWCFRNFVWVVVLLLSFPPAMAWTFGIVFPMYGSLNLLTAFLFAVLFGIGIDYGILMLRRYVEERARGLDVDHALATMFRHSGVACCMSGFNTSLSFLSLMLTDFKGFSEFGFITGIGIPMSLLTMFTSLPLVVMF